MSRIIQFAVFFTIFLSLYLALNAYVVLRLSNLFSVKKKRLVYALIVFLTLIFPFASLIENMFPNLFTRAVYTLSAYWMGVMFFLLCSLLIFEVVNFFMRVNPRKAGNMIVLIVVLLSVVATVNAFFVDVKNVTVPVRGLQDDISVVQLSDVHIGTIRNSAFLDKIVSIINDLDPDIVVITGDLVDGTAPLQEGMFSSFDSLRADILFVDGNHETYEGLDEVYALFEGSTIRVLKNEVFSFGGIQFVGVSYSQKKGHLKDVLDSIVLDSSMPSVLLYHVPSEYEAAASAGIDLQLSGHTHAGQMIPFNLLTMVPFPKYHGLYDIGDMKLYVSPGTGTWGPYMRLGSRNEITYIKLVRQ